MIIRHTSPSDLPTLLKIYSDARDFMREVGNPNQWGTSYPTLNQLQGDINQNVSYVCTDEDGTILGTFVYYFGDDLDPNYKTIRDGSWPDNLPYGVVHRITSRRGTHGVATFCINWAYEQSGHHLRIDTHRQNIPMQNLVRKLGFSYCGIVIMTNGDGSDRDAFIKC